MRSSVVSKQKYSKERIREWYKKRKGEIEYNALTEPPHDDW